MFAMMFGLMSNSEDHTPLEDTSRSSTDPRPSTLMLSTQYSQHDDAPEEALKHMQRKPRKQWNVKELPSH
eukprot:6104268-Amphidinium_carterae.2